MEPQMKKENISVRLKNILRENNVKLWLPPYYDETKNDSQDLSNTDSLRELADNYRQILNIEFQQCLEMLLEIQCYSLQALREKNKFQEDGLATIRVKVSGTQPTEFSIQIKLSDSVEEMKRIISSILDVSADRLKIISGGKVLQPQLSLECQKIKHNGLVLVLLLEDKNCGDVLMEARNNNQILEDTRKDIETLTKNQTQKDYLSITNQNGYSMNIPEFEKKILLTAMTLHEKGRTIFKTSQYSLALLLFLEADNEFKLCHFELLEKVDNYGLLNLDIVWTYLHLQSLHHLSDAENRLKISEQTLKRCYGSSFERLNSIKGSSGNERVLFVRLRLLQGIMCHLRNKKDEAAKLFEEVETEIQTLKIDRENVKSLRKLGYSSQEARLALRATYNDVNAAANYILRQREEQKARDEYERIRSFADHHICDNGNEINLTVLEQLHDMGYKRLISVHALAHCNNEINQALLWIENFKSELENQYPPYVVDVLISVEFNSPGVRSILKKYNYKLTDLCIRELIYATPIGREYIQKMIIENPRFLVPNINQGTSSAASTVQAVPGTSASAVSEWTIAKTEAEYLEEEDALMRLRADISSSAQDYLDCDLKSEEKYLELYKSFST